MRSHASDSTPSSRLRAATVCTVLLACAAQLAGTTAAQADSTTWYVSAAAGSGGDGSASAPFATLAQVEAASRPGDTIVVAAASPALPPLDGGVTLKSGQTLRGDGPAVIGAATGAALPRLTKTGATHNGDAVVLAPGARVENLVVAGANRGGIYGQDAAGAVITGNDVSSTNRLCADGFIIGPFQLPPTIPLGVAMPPLPGYITLNNGWAGIMTDFSSGAASLRIDGNSVHDTACGDGIDVRAKGSSRLDLEEGGNTLQHINLGLGKQSVLAMGVQADGSAQVTATLNGNAQTDIAPPATSATNAAADSEGVFLNPLGQAQLTATIDGNRFRNGGGNFSANGLEYVTTSGTPDSRVTVTNSDFDTVTGDIIENYNLSTDGAHQSLTLDGVRAHHSTLPASALNPSVPANLGTCVVTTNFGRTAQTGVTIHNADLGDCSADGIGLVAYTPTGSTASTAALRFDIADTTVNGVAANGVDIINIGDTALLQGTLARVTLAASQKALLRTSSQDGTIAGPVIDAGGGALGSPGANCFAANAASQLELHSLSVVAQSDWWGQSGGPNPSRVTLDNATLDTANPLSAPPRPGC